MASAPEHKYYITLAHACEHTCMPMACSNYFLPVAVCYTHQSESNQFVTGRKIHFVFVSTVDETKPTCVK